MGIRVIIAGGRTLTDYGIVVEAIHLARFDIGEVVSGACGIDGDDPYLDKLEAQGGDGLGEAWAKANGIPIRRFYAYWKRFGQSAGHRRNAEMAAYGNALIALPGNRGTNSMIKHARERGIPVFDMAKAPMKLYRSERFHEAIRKIGGPTYTIREDGPRT